MTAPQKKSVIMLYIITILVMSLTILPRAAHATVPVVDDKAIGKLDDILKEAKYQSSQLKSLNEYFYVKKPEAKYLASLILQLLTKSIISWIQGGGNTNFVSNLQAALGRAADQAAGEFINQLAGANLCTPFANPLRNIFNVGLPNLYNTLSCSATDIFQNLQTSYQNFLGDFSRGGWPAYQATLSGGNNYIDALITSIDEKLKAESERVDVTRAKYEAGNGFIGVNVKKEDCSDGFVDENGNPLCGTVDVQTTPGHLVAEELNKAVGAGIDQAVNINDIGQALDSIIAALMNKLITSAQSGLETNNEASGILGPDIIGLPPPQGPPPDLTVADGPVPIQQNILAGDLVTFSGIIKNQGGRDVNIPFNARFQIDLNNDGTVDETLSPSPTVTGVNAGGQKTVTSAQWRAVDGTHRVILCADQPNPIVDETLTTNNCNPTDTGVFTVGARPDLVVSDNPSVYSGSPVAGQSITFRGAIKNQGGATATTTFQSRFQIDLNNNGTVDVTLTPHPTIANLVPNATQGVISAPWTAVEGTHRVILCADEPSETIIESDKTNNCSPAGTGVFTIQPYVNYYNYYNY